MLLQLCEHLRSVDEASVQQLARVFHLDEQALQPMLDLCVKRGIIIESSQVGNCKQVCGGCGQKGVIYRAKY